LVEDFCGRLVHRRGLAQSTVTEYRHSVLHFLQQVLQPGQPLRRLRPRSLESYILSRSRELARSSLRAAVRCIRAFLLDCYHRGLLPERLDHIDMPRDFRRDLCAHCLI
jgi:site-specific recombinase XerD